ncbi:hypothetical protein CsSME_00035300 [Camellia sinensis var. sinensis]
MFVWFNFVAVGNIPYDATEEQLIQICEEVGPVVSFRLVIDRETGKPKGYGFCEYKDEETALSARRNLQGYEINGRQLRVDFAENDKNTDRNREQGRGGPGMVANVDPQKQFGGPTVTGDSGSHQPIGLQVAMAAASVMAGVLGGAQGRREMNQNGLQGQPALYSDPLTLHLAKMSRNQLNEVMFELKVMAMQNKEQARQLLLANPQLAKAVFEAQIMLEMVTPQMKYVYFPSNCAVADAKYSAGFRTAFVTRWATRSAASSSNSSWVAPSCTEQDAVWFDAQSTRRSNIFSASKFFGSQPIFCSPTTSYTSSS